MSADQTWNAYAAGEVRAILARNRLTARDLAERMGVKRMWVQYRLAETTPMQLDDLQRIAVALEVEVTALLPAARDVNARYGRVSGRPRSTAKLHARNSTPRPTPTSAERHPVAAAAGADSAPRSRPFWRHA